MLASLIATGFRFYGTTRPIHIREAWNVGENFPDEIKDIAEPAARIIARLPAKHYKMALQIIDPACLLIAAFGLFMACSSLEIALHNEYLKSNPQPAKGFNGGSPTPNTFETSAFNGHPASNGTGAGNGNSSDFPDSSAARLHLYTQGPGG